MIFSSSVLFCISVKASTSEMNSAILLRAWMGVYWSESRILFGRK